MAPVGPRRNRSLSVLFTHCRPVPGTGSYTGSPRSRIISAGVKLTKTDGACAAVNVFPGTAAFTAVQFSSAGSLLKLGGSLAAGVQGPSTAAAVIQLSFTRRKYAFVGPCSNRSQLVFTANLRSFAAIGLQIGLPSMFTSTDSLVLKNTGGGSAFMSGTLRGVIWLESMLASTRSSAMMRSF